MSHHLELVERSAWLEVEGGGGEPQYVYCPRRNASMPLQLCLACPRFSTLALHPAGTHVYIVCAPFDEPSAPDEPPPGAPFCPE